ncbi:Restriction endonuclease EcoRII, N-terminal [Alteromonadaceae bacterium Bs31]|nr:Restriction endonuclease EcoRII, N-terminal [Alteromonadaceae bacterium Bs31]
MSSYKKILTKNDVGETGGHQAGITIPKKNTALLEFFPSLDKDSFNPEEWIVCVDPDGNEWDMRYVYYNGKTFTPRKSTRNEYRITYMTKFFKRWNVKSEDSVIFKDTNRKNRYQLSIERKDEEDLNCIREPKVVVLRGWSKAY